MNSRKLFTSIVCFILLSSFVIGCTSPDANAVSPPSPSDTNISNLIYTATTTYTPTPKILSTITPTPTLPPTSTLGPTYQEVETTEFDTTSPGVALYPPSDPGDCPRAGDASRDVWHCTASYFNSNRPIPTSNPDWMGKLSDALYISELSIPGTHGTWYFHGGFWDWKFTITHRARLDEQLDSGIRALDIRVRYTDDNYWNWGLYHNKVFQDAHFHHVLEDAVDFLEKNPSETILMKVSTYDDNFSRDHHAEIFEMYMDQEYKGTQFKEWFWQGDGNNGFNRPPRLGDVRGKIVLLQDFPSEIPYGIPWYSFIVQDSYKVSSASRGGMDKKWEYITNQINAAMNDPERTNWYVNFLSGSTYTYPADVANGLVILGKWCDGMNKRTLEYITSCYGHQCAPSILSSGEHGRLGLVMMDFPGASLIEAIIAHNEKTGPAGGLAVTDLDGNSQPDLITFYIRDPGGENVGLYRIGGNLNEFGYTEGGIGKDDDGDGQPDDIKGWSESMSVRGWFGEETAGGGLAVTDLDENGQPDLIVFHIDNPAGENVGYYRIGKNPMMEDGYIHKDSWTDPIRIPGWFGEETVGGGVAVTDLDENDQPDLIVFHIEDTGGENVGYYRIGMNLNANGDIKGGWTDPILIPGWFGEATAGAGVAVTDLDGNGRPDLIVFHVDKDYQLGGRVGYYRVGGNLNVEGHVTGLGDDTDGDGLPDETKGWTDPIVVPGWYGEWSKGAGITVADLDQNGRPDLIAFVIEDPSGENIAHYRLIGNLDSNGNFTGGGSWTTAGYPIPGTFGR